MTTSKPDDDDSENERGDLKRGDKQYFMGCSRVFVLKVLDRVLSHARKQRSAFQFSDLSADLLNGFFVDEREALTVLFHQERSELLELEKAYGGRNFHPLDPSTFWTKLDQFHTWWKNNIDRKAKLVKLQKDAKYSGMDDRKLQRSRYFKALLVRIDLIKEYCEPVKSLWISSFPEASSLSSSLMSPSSALIASYPDFLVLLGQILNNCESPLIYWAPTLPRAGDASVDVKAKVEEDDDEDDEEEDDDDDEDNDDDDEVRRASVGAKRKRASPKTAQRRGPRPAARAASEFDQFVINSLPFGTDFLPRRLPTLTLATFLEHLKAYDFVCERDCDSDEELLLVSHRLFTRHKPKAVADLQRLYDRCRRLESIPRKIQEVADSVPGPSTCRPGASVGSVTGALPTRLSQTTPQSQSPISGVPSPNPLMSGGVPGPSPFMSVMPPAPTSAAPTPSPHSAPAAALSMEGWMALQMQHWNAMMAAAMQYPMMGMMMPNMNINMAPSMAPSNMVPAVMMMNPLALMNPISHPLNHTNPSTGAASANSANVINPALSSSADSFADAPDEELSQHAPKRR